MDRSFLKVGWRIDWRDDEKASQIWSLCLISLACSTLETRQWNDMHLQLKANHMICMIHAPTKSRRKKRFCEAFQQETAFLLSNLNIVVTRHVDVYETKAPSKVSSLDQKTCLHPLTERKAPLSYKFNQDMMHVRISCQKHRPAKKFAF